jgi:NAD(P)-dependent dehydrogenase (short-subunit alcohol dehydrogenase family)
MNLVEGKTAIVTGAAGGLGIVTCRTLAKNGARIVALDLSSEKVDEVVLQLESEGIGNVIGVVADVASATSVATAFAEIKQRVGPIDVLVNNAGVREIKAALDLSPAEWDRVIGINLSGPFYCAREAGLQMRETGGGAIVNIASVAGILGIARRPAYTTAKHGIVGMTKTLAREFAEYGIRVNTVAPGTVRTPMTEHYFQDAEFVRGLKHSVPLHDRGSAQDIANAILFLSSSLADFITGVTLPVDGGWTSEKTYAAADSASFFGTSAAT